MMAPRHLLLIVLALLAITETSSHRFNRWLRWQRWRQCRALPTLCNGQVTRNGWNKIDYVCNTGFRLAVMADCKRGRSWTPRVTCEEILCEGDPPIVNGSLDTVIESRSVGAEYNFTCDAGFKGMGKVVCNEFGKWDVGETECTECVALKDRALNVQISGSDIATEALCTQACNNNNPVACSFSTFTNRCTLYPPPFIAVSSQPTLQDCINACNSNAACKLLSYRGPVIRDCYLTDSDDIGSLRSSAVAPSTILGRDCQI